jgi:hypothetical protein
MDDSGRAGLPGGPAARRQNLRDFLKGFFFTIVIVMPVFVMSGILARPQPGLDNGETTQSAAGPAQNVAIGAQKSYNLLYLLSDSRTNNLLSVALARFDVGNYRAVVCNIPGNSIILDAGSPISLLSLYIQRGASGIKSAVEETLHIPVSGYISLKTDDLSGIIDSLGELSFTLDKKLTVQNAEGLTIYSKDAGTSIFSGNDVVQLLSFGVYSEAEFMRIHEDLWRAAFMAYGDDKLPGRLETLYAGMVDAVDTDISQAGMFSLSQAASAVCRPAGTQLEIVRPAGSFVEGRFEFSEGADRLLQDYFGQTAAASR